VEPDEARAGAPRDASGPGVGGDLTPPDVPWWANTHVRLALLLAGLVAAVLVLLSVRVGLFDFGNGPTQARGAAFASVCQGGGAPEVERTPLENLPALRNVVSRTMPPRVGRLYETGTITTSNLWSDNQPIRQSISSPLVPRSVPAAYEMRWWALDRNGNEDDVVADVLEYATERQAESALALAASATCRRDAAAHAGHSPSGARHVFWVNPDNAREWDVLFVRGHRLYRVADAPPSYPPARGAAQRTFERLGAEATVEALACALPGAACHGPALSTRAANLATLTISPLVQTSTNRATDLVRARAYGRAVNLHDYDVPGMAEVAPERSIRDRRYWDAFVRCTGELRSPHALEDIDSPVFSSRGRLQYDVVASTVAILRTEAVANRYLDVLASARARACIAHSYRRPLLGRGARRNLLRVARISAALLPAAAPTSYRGLGPYRGTASRLTIWTSYATRRGGEVSLPFYIDDFAFAYGRALIALTTESVSQPFSQASEQYLMAKLVGRAEANEP
jgi:hypothetical protein